MVKSKIHYNWYLWFLGMMLCEIGLFFFTARVIFDIMNGKKTMNTSLVISFLILIIIMVFVIIVVKDFKYIKIDKEKNQLKYYSILSPFGRTLNLENYENKIITSEVSIQGSYDVIHLVNKKGYTAFKISGLFYENFKEINSSIKLQRIYNYRFNWKLYLKLLFTGRIKVQQK